MVAYGGKTLGYELMQVVRFVLSDACFILRDRNAVSPSGQQTNTDRHTTDQKSPRPILDLPLPVQTPIP